jgi:hypothetical protein
MAKAIQGRMDTVIVQRGTAGVFDTVVLLSAIFNAAAVGAEFVLWEMVVPAQQKIRWGYGTPQLPMNQSYASMYALDATTAYEYGILTLCAQNAPRTDTRRIKSMDDRNLRDEDAGFTAILSQLQDKNQMIALPEMGVLIGKDSRLQLRYLPTVLSGATDTVFFSLGITQYMV